MPYLVGEPIIDLVTLRDSAGSVVTGATWTVAYSKTDSGAAATTTVEETGSPGTYLVTTETDTQTSYHRILTATDGADTYAWSGTAHTVTRGTPFEHYVSEAVTEVVYLMDDDGAGIGGVTFTTDVSSDPNGDAFTVTASAITGVTGGYLLTFTPDVAGVWSAEIVTDTTPERRYAFTASVFPTGQAVTGAALSGSGQVTWQRITTFRGTVTWSRLT